jgi:hypothetical protein
LAFGTLYATEFLRLPSRWWFEDDPFLFAYVSTIHNPIRIFIDPGILRQFTGGAALVPMQVLSYWVDVRLAGFSPGFAYGHQICSFLLTLLLFYLLLARYLRDRTAALVGTLVWALLPATAVVLQFLATRHYMEGLLFSALSLYLADRLFDRDGPLRWWKYVAVLAPAAIGMLYKEIYAPIVPVLLLAHSWKRRDQRLVVLTAATALGYAFYRSWVLAFDLRYDQVPLLTPWEYVRFLSKLPYTFSSNYGSYLIFGLCMALYLYALLRRKDAAGMCVCFLGVIIVSLLAIFPVSYPLYGLIRRPDPWYRIVFLLNSIIVGFTTCIVVRYTGRRVQGVLAVVTLAVLLPGIVKTRGLWTELTDSAEREGKFYLSNPDKLLLSEQEAWWFLPGVNQMYDVRPPHYVLLKDLATTRIKPGTALWRFTDGHFVQDYDSLTNHK